MCEICLHYAGDSEDNLIRFITDHHPACPVFKIDKKKFLDEFEKQVEFFSNRLLEKNTEKLNKVNVSTKIINALYGNFKNKYFPIVSNCYIYDWESDLLAVNIENNFITEYEIKISRQDFKADFKKSAKHTIISDSYQYNFSSNIPNYFYYTTPPGLLNKFEIPHYAGLIEVGISTRIVKNAPILHEIPITKIDIDNLLKKVYNKYWKNE